MRLLTRYVLFFCDDCKLLAPAIDTFQKNYKFHAVITSEDESDFFEKLKQYKPELLLIYLHDPSKEYMSLTRAIRETPDYSSIPILIYNKLPSPEDMVENFQKMLSFED